MFTLKFETDSSRLPNIIHTRRGHKTFVLTDPKNITVRYKRKCFPFRNFPTKNDSPRVHSEISSVKFKCPETPRKGDDATLVANEAR